MKIEEKEFWADAMTKNCVWLFQIKEDEEHWRTETVFLTNEEANDWGNRRPYAWGKKNVGWRIFGVPCYGLMAELLSKHIKEFESKVDYVV